MKKVLLCIGLAVIFGLLESVSGSSQSIDFSEILLCSSFLKMTFRIEYLIDFAFRMIKFLVFQNLWGTYIY